jgi:hypothetical protein
LTVGLTVSAILLVSRYVFVARRALSSRAGGLQR